MANELITSQQLQIFGNRIKTSMDNMVLEFSNPNLLDNWYFLDPVNQYNASVSSIDLGYFCIDRWSSYYSDQGKYKYDKDLGLSNYNTNNLSMEHGISQNIKIEYLPPGKYTFSCFSSNGIGGGRIYIAHSNGNIFERMSKNDFTVYSYTFIIDAPLTNVSITVSIFFKDYSSSTSNYIRAVKLERGSRQTLMVKDSSGNWMLNDIPRKDLETLKCKRYLYVIGADGNYIGPIFYKNSNTGFCAIPIPAILNQQSFAKVIGGANAFEIFVPDDAVNGSTIAISSIKYAYQHGGYAFFVVKTSSSVLTNDSFYVVRKKTDNARIIFST